MRENWANWRPCLSTPQRDFPPDLQSVIDEIARSEQEARELVEGLTDAQMNWQPNSGAAWSIAQCLDHLARINAIYLASLRAALRERNSATAPRSGPIRPGWLSGVFIRTVDAPPRRKFSAPTQAMPTSQIGAEDALDAFIHSHDEVRALLLECVDVDLNHIRFKNPFVRVLAFTVGTGLLIILAHYRRHLWQARQVRNALVGQASR